MKLPVPLAFDWNEGNINKSQSKHQVFYKETEEIFFNRPLRIYRDTVHSQNEERYVALGVTDKNRKLFIVFVIRRAKIRIISARDQSKKERKLYA